MSASNWLVRLIALWCLGAVLVFALAGCRSTSGSSGGGTAAGCSSGCCGK